MNNEELERRVKAFLANSDHTAALRELLSRHDQDAIRTIRGYQDTKTEEVQQAVAVLQHNERLRNMFRVASPEKDPFA